VLDAFPPFLKEIILKEGMGLLKIMSDGDLTKQPCVNGQAMLPRQVQREPGSSLQVIPKQSIGMAVDITR